MMTKQAKRTSVRRLGWLSTMAVLMVSGVLGVSAQTAGASPLLSCTGTEHHTFSPGLTDVKQTVELSTYISYDLCLGLLEDRTGVISEKYVIPELSCTSLLEPLPATAVIDWSTGGKSTLDYTATATNIDGNTVLAIDGTIINGEFAGDPVAGANVFVNSQLDACSESGGLKSANGEAELDIL